MVSENKELEKSKQEEKAEQYLKNEKHKTGPERVTYQCESIERENNFLKPSLWKYNRSSYLINCIHCLSDIKSMSPVVISYWSVVFLYGQYPPTEHLREDQTSGLD